MSIKIFAAIDVGSYELSMKIFEISSRKKIREIDHIRHRIDLGTETYTVGKLSHEKVDELCRVLCEYSEIMKAYKVSDYKAYGTSAIREMKNRAIVLEQIKMRTGIQIDVLSNSEQRFLDYKSIASRGERFNGLISKGTAIIDIGGGSIQVSLFDKDSLVTTQNMRLGILRIRERLSQLKLKASQYEEIIDELLAGQVEVLEKLYLKERKIDNIIVVDEYISSAFARRDKGLLENYIDGETYLKFVEEIRTQPLAELGKDLGMPEESVFLLYISSIMVRKFLRTMGAKLVWIPGVTLCDGIGYEYAEKNRVFSTVHDFEKDIIDCTQNISKRYLGSKKRGETLEKIAITVFDSMKRVHGLGRRERLLLRLAALLHDCGKYISMTNVGEASYEIIMSTEIIGLSHVEREIVANVVRYNYREFAYYGEGKDMGLDKQSYLIAAKLTAILRVASGLDRSHKEKFRNIVATLRDRELVLTVDTPYDITLEKGLFASRAKFFEEIFEITPVIKRKRGV